MKRKLPLKLTANLDRGILGIQKGIIETAKSMDVRVVTVAPYFVSM